MYRRVPFLAALSVPSGSIPAILFLPIIALVGRMLFPDNVKLSVCLGDPHPLSSLATFGHFQERQWPLQDGLADNTPIQAHTELFGAFHVCHLMYNQRQFPTEP